jgi:large subunit ribosomal protein L9
MQVILREDVRHLGYVGDIVSVKSGYARNYLFPRKLAVHADTRQMNRLEHEKRIIEARLQKTRADADRLAEMFRGFGLIVKKAAGENDKLFGSVTSMEVESLLNEKGFAVERRQIIMSENLKTLGSHKIQLRLHRDVVIDLNVEVIREEDL